MNQFWSGNECEILTHSQQRSQAPKTHKKEVNSQDDYQNHNDLPPPPPQDRSFTGLRTQLK